MKAGRGGLDLPFPLLLLRSSRMCLENVVHLPLKVEKNYIDNIRPPRECASGSERTPCPLIISSMVSSTTVQDLYYKN